MTWRLVYDLQTKDWLLKITEFVLFDSDRFLGHNQVGLAENEPRLY